MTNLKNDDYTNLMEEIKSRRADKDEMLYFVMGLISDSPNAKETILVNNEEQPFRSEERCDESKT